MLESIITGLIKFMEIILNTPTKREVLAHVPDQAGIHPIEQGGNVTVELKYLNGARRGHHILEIDVSGVGRYGVYMRRTTGRGVISLGKNETLEVILDDPATIRGAQRLGSNRGIRQRYRL